MANLEILKIDGDPRLWTPSSRLRPHHLNGDQVFGKILRGQIPIDTATQVLANTEAAFDIDGDLKDYLNDKAGNTEESQRRYVVQLASALRQYCSLQDNDPVLISPYPDLICDSCIIGSHCLATNFRQGQENIDVIKNEQKDLYEVQDMLDAKKYRRGTDFVSCQIRAGINNYQGQLINSTQPPKVESYIFDGLVIKFGTLKMLF